MADLAAISASGETTCPLCGGVEIGPFLEDQRTYLSCLGCRLVFVPERERLSLDEQRAVYDLHENDAGDPGYRRFLSRFTTPLLTKLEPGRQGLDFGCGPGPTVSVLLREGGHEVDLYDPIYHDDRSVFDKSYDFVCATEVVEHLHEPGRELSRLFGILRPGGWLGIMTKVVTDKDAFSRWHYIRDPTHVCFFSRTTFEYLARRFEAELHFFATDVFLLRKRL